jgi:hypothetical protein
MASRTKPSTFSTMQSHKQLKKSVECGSEFCVVTLPFWPMPREKSAEEMQYSEQALPYADDHQFACYIKPGVRQEKRPLARPLLG